MRISNATLAPTVAAIKDGSGTFVLYTDHTAALRERDERIAALENALKWALPFAESAPDPSRTEDDCPSPEWQKMKIQARAALEAK